MRSVTNLVTLLSELLDDMDAANSDEELLEAAVEFEDEVKTLVGTLISVLEAREMK